MKIAKILVPLDGSPMAEAILPFIEQIAGPRALQGAVSGAGKLG